MRGLYVHLPFCRKKCDYCDFVSYANCYDAEERYVNALIEEFSRYRGEMVDTVYFGGGTPTSLKPESLKTLLSGVMENFTLTPDTEITMECNPKTADFETFSMLRAWGVNRLSIGVQSFEDRLLSLIGRIHSSEDAKSVILDASKAGFSNISADLMFGLPGQTIEDVRRSVEIMTSLPVSHISCYGLILEEGTPLYKKVESGTLTLPDEDTEFSMYRTLKDELKARGFLQYEISNFAKEGYRSRHNTKYWNAEEYIGCGAAAHSYFQNTRFCHTSNLEEYIKNPMARQDEEEISQKEQMTEFMILGLRKTEGVSKKTFSARFGTVLTDVYGHIITPFVEKGLLLWEDDFLRFSEEGLYVSNAILCEFM